MDGIYVPGGNMFLATFLKNVSLGSDKISIHLWVYIGSLKNEIYKSSLINGSSLLTIQITK